MAAGWDSRPYLRGSLAFSTWTVDNIARVGDAMTCDIGVVGLGVMGGNLARQWATQDRPEGDATVYGAEAELGWTFSDTLDGFVLLWWNHEGFSDEIHDASPDLDPIVPFARSDNLYEAVGGLSWTFAPGWTLRPEVVWLRDQSDVDV